MAAVRWITAGLMNAAGLIGRDRRAVRAPARAELDRAALADRRRHARVGDQGRRVREGARVVAADRLGHALERAAGDRVRGARHPGRLTGDRDRHVDPLELGVPPLAGGLGGQLDGEVGRQRLEPAHLHHLDLGLGGGDVEVRDDPAHEGDLAGEVDVVRAGAHARLDHRPAAGRVRADEVEHHLRARGHRGQRGGVADVGGDRRGRLRADLRQGGLELRRIAPRGAPIGADLGQIAPDLAPGDAGRAEDDHVEVSLGVHQCEADTSDSERDYSDSPAAWSASDRSVKSTLRTHSPSRKVWTSNVRSLTSTPLPRPRPR